MNPLSDHLFLPPQSTIPKWPPYLTSGCPDLFKLSNPDWHSLARSTPLNGFPYLIDLMDYVDAKMFGTSDAIDKVKSDANRKDTMHTWQIKRKAHQGPCLCDDCGKHMQWKGIDWCITNNG
jgi:hypothetical protein